MVNLPTLVMMLPQSLLMDMRTGEQVPRLAVTNRHPSRPSHPRYFRVLPAEVLPIAKIRSVPRAPRLIVVRDDPACRSRPC
jgi:hypothetical protein